MDQKTIPLFGCLVSLPMLEGAFEFLSEEERMEDQWRIIRLADDHPVAESAETS